ncbi:MAG: hypothetical protein ACM3ON_07005 [Chloroflexota bacterium]
MQTRQLLFVTYYDENIWEGFPYAFNLARLLNEGITVLLLHRKRVSENFSTLMTAGAFAEANDHDGARQLMAEEGIGDERIGSFLKEHRGDGVHLDVRVEKEGLAEAVRNFIKHKSGVDMILLSPTVTDKRRIRVTEINRLVRAVSKPVVTMTRSSTAN